MDSEALTTAETYWNKAAETYERKFSGTIVGQIRRRVVWSELERAFHTGDTVLEINCGTGIDAVHLGGHNISVSAYDISPKMIEMANEHADSVNPICRPHFGVLATEHLERLEHQTFDGAFSNFSGLNCVEDLSIVSRDVARLLKPKGRFVICMMGKLVPIEIGWFLFHGRPQKAFSRLFRSRESGTVQVRMPTVHQISVQMQNHFRLVRRRGAGITVPPSYAEGFALRVPRLMRFLAEFDQRVGHLPVIRSMADCAILTFEKI